MKINIFMCYLHHVADIYICQLCFCFITLRVYSTVLFFKLTNLQWFTAQKAVTIINPQVMLLMHFGDK